jgi:neurofibromin 1
LAVALLQSSYTAFYSDAAELMRATVETLEKHGAFEGSSIPNVLLDGRVSLEDTVCQLDHLLCLSFDSSFSFTLAAIIFKGVRHNHLRSSAELVLRSLLSVTARCNNQTEDGSASGLCPDALGYFIALLPFCTTHEAYVQLLQDCKGEEFLPAPNSCHSRLVPRVSIELLSLTDSTSALLTVSFASTLLTTAQGDDAETEILYNLLADIGVTRPESVSIMQVLIYYQFSCTDSSSKAMIFCRTGSKMLSPIHRMLQSSKL